MPSGKTGNKLSMSRSVRGGAPSLAKSDEKDQDIITLDRSPLLSSVETGKDEEDTTSHHQDIVNPNDPHTEAAKISTQEELLSQMGLTQEMVQMKVQRVKENIEKSTSLGIVYPQDVFVIMEQCMENRDMTLSDLNLIEGVLEKALSEHAEPTTLNHVCYHYVNLVFHEGVLEKALSEHAEPTTLNQVLDSKH